MNFTDPQDFYFVKGDNVDAGHPFGDLDRIIIGNDIMPVRAADKKKHLRGIDIAFIEEAAADRYHLDSTTIGQARKSDFSRAIIAKTGNLRNAYLDLGHCFDSHNFLKDGYAFAACYHAANEYLYLKFAQSFFALADMSAIDPDHGDPLEQSVIESYFYDIAKLNTFYLWNNVQPSSSQPTISKQGGKWYNPFGNSPYDDFAYDESELGQGLEDFSGSGTLYANGLIDLSAMKGRKLLDAILDVSIYVRVDDGVGEVKYAFIPISVNNDNSINRAAAARAIESFVTKPAHDFWLSITANITSVYGIWEFWDRTRWD